MKNLIRTKMPKRNAVRIELERFVVASNNCLNNVVATMDIIILLRNAHPSLRSDYAYRLRDEGLIQPSQVSEFINRPDVMKKFKYYA